MTLLFSFQVWHPRLVGDKELVVTLTPGESSELNADGEFVSELLNEMHVASGLKEWDVLPLRSSYHGDPEASDWQDRWPKLWRVRMRLAAPLMKAPQFKYESIGIEAVPATAPDGNSPEKSTVACIVCADLHEKADVETVRNRLAESEKLKEFQKALKASGMAIDSFVIATGLVQVQIHLGSIPTEVIESGFAYAAEVESICSTAGAICNFEQRVAEWDEQFDEGGF